MSQPHRLSQAAWYLVRQYAGIYDVKMDYSAIKTYLKPETVARAYFEVANLPLITKTVTCDLMGQAQPHTMDISTSTVAGVESHRRTRADCMTLYDYETEVKSVTPNDWVDVILKRAATGYKNREFYEELARVLAVWRTPFADTVIPPYQWNAMTGHPFNLVTPPTHNTYYPPPIFNMLDHYTPIRY